MVVFDSDLQGDDHVSFVATDNLAAGKIAGDHVAKLLGVSLSWLAKSRLNGTGPRFIKIGRAVRYAMSAVREFILSRQRNSTSER